jgi:hypothetical protein
MPDTVIASFVLRFMLDQEVETSATHWRGVIRHIQTNEQLNFSVMEEALSFMQQYMHINPIPAQPCPEKDGQ